MLRDSSILAKDVGGDFIAPDSLLQEVDIPFFNVSLLIIIPTVRKCDLSQILQTTDAGCQSCGSACAHPWSI